MRSTIILGVIAVLVALAACTREEPATVSDGNVAGEDAAQEITDEFIREIIAEISSDAYEGRGPGSIGDVKARQYLASRLADLGLLPGAADGTWEQRFDLVGVNSHQPAKWNFERAGSSLTIASAWKADETTDRSGKQALPPRSRLSVVPLGGYTFNMASSHKTETGGQK